MLIDSRNLAAGTVVRTTVCIIGGGPAGVALALDLERAGITSVILESGSVEADKTTLRLYEGESVGLPYEFAQGHRSRYLGGNSNCWGGFCRPWDDWAFSKRDWIPHSGWPIGRQDLDPYYLRVGQLLKVGSDNFDPAYWAEEPDREDVARYPIPPSEFFDGVSLLSPPVKFGEDYREELERSSAISLYLWANVVDIETSAGSTQIQRVHVRTLGGVAFKIEAQLFVLAAGGIENARLLLASNRVHRAGLGNAHDQVGRYFADHPRLRWGKIHLSPEQRDNRFYDLTFNFIAGRIGMGSARASGYMSLPQAMQQKEGLLDAHVWLRSLFYGEQTEIVMALSRMKQRILARHKYGYGLRSDAATLMRHPLRTAAFTASYFARVKGLVREICFEAVVESDPDPDCRITLSDERDALGMPRTRIDWRLSPQVARTFDRTFTHLADSMEKAGVARIERGGLVERDGWPADLEGTWHHMGSTRMHTSPREGVVDANCQVHGLSNLYVAGSSVFPTYAANHPTFTLLALTLRLSDHLQSQVRAATTVVQTPAPAEHGVG